MPHYARFDGLDDFEQFYCEEIVPTLRADPDIDVDPDRNTPPTRGSRATSRDSLNASAATTSSPPASFTTRSVSRRIPTARTTHGESATNRLSEGSKTI